MEMNTIKEILTILSTTASTTIFVIIAAFLVYGFKLLCNKLGITLNDSVMNEIIGIVSTVIKYFDQKFVDTIKKNSVDGTLTEYQKQMIKDKSVEMVKSILNSNQIDFLLQKYKMDDIDEVLDILIESNIKDSRSNNNETIVINDNETDINNFDDINDQIATMTYTPTNEELTSIGLCPGNCETCTLSKECTICRLDKIK